MLCAVIYDGYLFTCHVVYTIHMQKHDDHYYNLGGLVLTRLLFTENKAAML